ncbi:hypothetical protein LTS18_008134 [Coniosporium uncinatum]|uniref:Uncharacterized protein n=1 Tax=Coniosporium uncinatum TaxID=93489 RepID=A0ACC3D1W9_9PEZI|nr:hypothetical protein LTS18_008134 [Coniosporium uncinatum]
MRDAVVVTTGSIRRSEEATARRIQVLRDLNESVGGERRSSRTLSISSHVIRGTEIAVIGSRQCNENARPLTSAATLQTERRIVGPVLTGTRDESGAQAQEQEQMWYDDLYSDVNILADDREEERRWREMERIETVDRR